MNLIRLVTALCLMAAVTGCSDKDVDALVAENGLGTLDAAVQFTDINDPDSTYIITHVSEDSAGYSTVFSKRDSRQSGRSFRHSVFDCRKGLQKILSDGSTIAAMKVATPNTSWSPLVTGSAPHTIGSHACKTLGKTTGMLASIASLPVKVSTRTRPTQLAKPTTTTVAEPKIYRQRQSSGCQSTGSYNEISCVTGQPKRQLVSGYYRKNGTYVKPYYRSKRRR